MHKCFLGKEKPNTLEKRFDEQEKIIIELKVEDKIKAKEIEQLSDDINDLKKQLNKLKKTNLPNSKNNK